MKHQIGVDKPMRHDSPCELQPPPLLRKLARPPCLQGLCVYSLEGTEDLRWRGVVGHNPESAYKGKEPEHMQKEDYSFCKGEMVGEENVEPDREEDEGKGEESSLPKLVDGCLRVDE